MNHHVKTEGKHYPVHSRLLGSESSEGINAQLLAEALGWTPLTGQLYDGSTGNIRGHSRGSSAETPGFTVASFLLCVISRACP